MDKIKEIKLAGLSKKFSWYKTLYEERKLYIRDKLVNEEVFEMFRLVIKCTQEIYEDNWDIDFLHVSNTKIDIEGIVIHFPSLIITNSQKNKHTIKDLFVKIDIGISERGNNIKLIQARGGRMTITEAEYSSRYMHSHLRGNVGDPGILAPYYTKFCTGSGEINVHSMNINSEGFNESNFIQYLLAIVTLVNWESLEGTPYRKMREIVARGNNNSYYWNISVAEQYYSYFFTGIKSLPKKELLDFDLIFENQEVKILNNDRFKKYIHQLEMNDSNKAKYLCYMTTENIALRYNIQTVNGVQLPVLKKERIEYVYNKKLYTFKIENNKEKKEEPTIEYCLHPSTIDFIIRKLEYDINKKLIRKSTYDRYSNSDGDA